MEQALNYMENAAECVQSVSVLARTGCELCDAAGKVIAFYGNCCSECRICEGTGIQRSDCMRLHAFTAKASISEEGRYIYECPLGLSCVTSAVASPSGELMRLTAGPFLMEDVDDFVTFTLKDNLKFAYDNIDAIVQKIDNIPVLEPAEVNAVSRLLVYCAAYLGGLQSGTDYISRLESYAIDEWESANSLDSSGVLKKAVSYIEEHFDENINLSDIAESAGVTTSYLCRLFKKQTGYTINGQITQLRIDKSKKLLADGIPISEVSSMCGFSDQSYFTKVFRQVEGVTPLKYRKQQ